MAVAKFAQLKTYLDSEIIGQPHLTQALLIAVLADGHLLVEGPPGLAKTRAVNALAKGLEGSFQRIQFTPDLLPSDVTGTDIYRQQTSEFVFEPGPLFHNLVLADEINRAPAKVQSALLEAMAERQITVGKNTYPLEQLFMVMATQNPLEQEGTYPLPEAQLDRFLLHLNIDYPDADSELAILRLTRGEALEGEHARIEPLTQADLFAARKEVLALHLAEPLEQYLVQLIMATRDGKQLDDQLASWLEYGASPRATIALDRAARAHAWLEGRDFVSPEDIQAVFHNVLRHRIILSYEAQADGITKDQVLQHILERVAVP
ncbi:MULTISPECIES: AAA family ATPase [Pseudoalteromonas]|uniref:ATPase AAA n=1 Tax=Pseudoalteromonas ruthenica TaxID=151081 RepID=A0A0F4PKZ8_9GAMM|nr:MULTISPECIES: MoxR family ATPase [Pseudoalteromonas]KJY96067.1 ATPase AAA [Pseudoalteromonas ruthenica]KJY96782.1 ATPase AAA [Pseudoalteromonas ruthenica]MCF2863518.1 MoxR family ATPase [Pseudoalteromonas sp. CNAT2-18]MCG7558471.1 MoxR family ATPase [Pseudoalteromonas sp. CNAT2-18.1]MCG7567599.1 MoxR family ATPase [Pseudoalteromonas sp. CnMc7-15]|tara:strand:+ start:1164 stop:2120 length:957 start_codon:yes stop_codon:yes gene_type:complete